jgi:hypothetical protein
VPFVSLAACSILETRRGVFRVPFPRGFLLLCVRFVLTILSGLWKLLFWILHLFPTLVSVVAPAVALFCLHLFLMFLLLLKFPCCGLVLPNMIFLFGSLQLGKELIIQYNWETLVFIQDNLKCCRCVLHF